MKIKYLTLTLICLGVIASAQSPLRERTLVSTDRSFYAAGDNIKCSAFCLESEGAFSSFSGIAYLEVYSQDGTIATGKVALVNGRGGCSIDIPADTPTGNYRIAAYTATNKNEEGYDFNTGSRVISIFNTSGTARVPGGVEIASEAPASVSAPHNSSAVRVSIGDSESGFIPISVSAADGASLSISVWKDEGFAKYDNNTLSTLEKSAWKKPTTHKNNVIGEYDGEVIYTRINGRADTSAIYLSSPGSNSDIYKGSLLPDGRTVFFTDNIFGDKDVAIISMSHDKKAFDVEIESPFKEIQADVIPKLQIAPSMKAGLTSLDAALRIGKAFDADTLYDVLNFRKLDLLGPCQNKYNLDDYTRFVTMREVFIEYLHDIHIERSKGELHMNVKTLDVKGIPSFRHFTRSLILLDGVPVMDDNVIYEMDPHLIKCVEIYPSNYSFGPVFFCGAANFVTYTGNLAGAQLGTGTRILSFKGASVPAVYSAVKAAFDPDFPAISETLYWNPMAKVSKEEAFDFEVVAPALPGNYVITVEGYTADGTPVFFSKDFSL